MDILNTLKTIDEVEGAYVEIGYGKGKSADVILTYMKEGKVRKRTSYLVDSFTSVPIQPAMDKRFFLPGYDIKVVKALLKDTIPNALKDVKIAVLQVDLGTKEANKNAITILSPLIVKRGIVIPTFYKEDEKPKGVEDIVEIKETAFGIRINKDKDIYIQSSGLIAPGVELGTKIQKTKIEVPEVRYKRK